LPIAAAERLDDSASPLTEVQAQVFSETGQLLSDSVNPQQAIMQFGQVTYRLNTASYVGQQARIYYVVPALISSLLDSHGVQVQWVGDGQLSDGSAYAGERKLVWSGQIAEPWFTAHLNVTAIVNLNLLKSNNTNFGFESYFEIETI
jgi:hypothetical protein